ncbi:UNVERIFIED_CONTAM: hypothetical protein Q9R58_21030, partial [Methylobacteriaceae bacterium AG10]|nr:hypothetical protein [Methylobacteriaceae bacterium AG10]
MTDVANPPGLLRRKGSSAYYAQFRYPQDLVEVAGRPHFKKSLRTSDHDLAPWPALILKLGSVEQETDDEEEPIQRRADHRHPEGAAG